MIQGYEKFKVLWSKIPTKALKKEPPGIPWILFSDVGWKIEKSSCTIIMAMGFQFEIDPITGLDTYQ